MSFLGLALLIPALSVSSAQAKEARPAAASPVAKEVFGSQKRPVPVAARAIGSYARGCLAGAKPLAVDGPAWQAMRLSRNRNWGHPVLVAYMERLAIDARQKDGWPGLLVGDMAQPVGGPMLTGHASHQIGLDADIWLTPMPDRRLSEKERETKSAVSVLARDGVSIDPRIWTADHAKLIKRAASYREVARIFVHPAIKKALCLWSKNEKQRDWLSKVRPWWGHHYHFHVRLSCPPNSPACVNQPSVGPDDGCGAEVENWLRRLRAIAARPKTPAKPAKPKPPMRLADLPSECAALVAADPEPTEAVVPTSAVPLPARRPEIQRTSSTGGRT